MTHEELSWRNTALAPLALVCRAWRGPVYRELYGDLRIAWLAGNVDKLVESFDNNAGLLPLVRRFEAFGVLASRLLMHRVEDSRMLILEEGAAALRSANTTFAQAEAEWKSTVAGQRYQGAAAPGSLEVVASVTESMKVAGHFAWTSRTVDQWGFEELLDLVEGAPNLRFLAVQGFAFDLPDHLLHRGPFKFTSLDTGNHSPLVLDMPRFSSFLAARAPDLRHLAASAPDDDEAADDPPTPLAALTSLRLEIDYKHISRTVIASLRLLQPSLRSLAFTSYGEVKWGAPLAPFLSTLDTLDLSPVENQQSETLPNQIAAITLPISQSTTLRHLRLALTFMGAIMGPSTDYRSPSWLPEQLLSALPSSLISLTLAPFEARTLGVPVADYFARMLVALKKSKPRPLRVTTISQSPDCDGLLEIIEEFREEGIELVV
ncbi:hypothetical protein RQP46_003330 [Phenoliferia psychrophenolica]